jgi:hypothetical protein
MDEQDSDSKPPEIDVSGSDGKQSEAVQGEVLPPVTESKIPDGPFTGAVAGIISDSTRGLTGNQPSQLLMGRLREFEAENYRLRNEREALRKDRDAKKDEIAELGAEAAAKSERIRSLKSIQIISSVCFVVASLIVTVTLFPEEDSLAIRDYLFLALSVLLYLVATLSPLLSGKERSI